tara:strand:+ start:304 stop:786 length:483 start_codon:yes stop_codon:yes gene_type:complete
MKKLFSYYLLVLLLINCSAPNNRPETIQVSEKEIKFEIHLYSNQGEIRNTFEFSGKDVEQGTFNKIPLKNIALTKLRYNQYGYFNLKIDTLEINNICYSPTIEVLENKDKDIISIVFNNDHNTVAIYGDSVKDIQISLSEEIVDREDFWLKNDKSFPQDC